MVRIRHRRLHGPSLAGGAAEMQEIPQLFTPPSQAKSLHNVDWLHKLLPIPTTCNLQSGYQTQDYIQKKKKTKES